jgi:hypothetical protein
MEQSNGPNSCPACGNPITPGKKYRCAVRGEYFGREATFFECIHCGFAYAPANFHAYNSKDDFARTSRPRDRYGRVGTSIRPGREFFMASMAWDCLSLAGLPAKRILVYGCGLSEDHQWIARKVPNAEVAVCDLENFQNFRNFIPLDSREQFDIVVACEVAEHFVDIQSDFLHLLSKVSPNGMAVVSTNISDGAPLHTLAYPFVPGHTAYYSGRSLDVIAKRFHPTFKVDFRSPQAAVAQLGPRKRYALFYKNESIPEAVSQYFSKHFLAPSEAPEVSAPTLMGRRLHRAWKRVTNSLDKMSLR